MLKVPTVISQYDSLVDYVNAVIPAEYTDITAEIDCIYIQLKCVFTILVIWLAPNQYPIIPAQQELLVDVMNISTEYTSILYINNVDHCEQPTVPIELLDYSTVLYNVSLILNIQHFSKLIFEIWGYAKIEPNIPQQNFVEFYSFPNAKITEFLLCTLSNTKLVFVIITANPPVLGIHENDVILQFSTIEFQIQLLIQLIEIILEIAPAEYPQL
ncbi:Hypothetical_protein [Hexamita inflata]|uniref:Hypothetical_protein n=1 Tax=Hexamita inflata TaxID=28002 RepID=A0AA86NWD6_9EUKA|nr:Hypothetical protein HINF_LOCUS14719 [Hexamita inflata]